MPIDGVLPRHPVASRRRFLRYRRVVGPFSGLIRREALRLVRARAERT